MRVCWVRGWRSLTWVTLYEGLSYLSAGALPEETSGRKPRRGRETCAEREPWVLCEDFTHHARLELLGQLFVKSVAFEGDCVVA